MTSTAQLPPDVRNENKGPAIVATICSLTVLATIFVAARLWVRIRIIGKMMLDDWLIIVAMICGYLSLGLSIAAVVNGDGRHFVTLSLEQKQNAILFTMAGFPPGIFSFGLPKLAIVSLLTKIMNPSRAHRIFLWAIASFALISLSGCIVILYAQCSPSRSQWDFAITDKTCWDPWVLVKYSICAGTISAVVDLYLAIYPAFVLAKLQMKRRKKLALSAALGLGSVATVVAIYKTTRLPSLASQDFSYDTSDLVIWTSIEGNTIIIASTIPLLQPLLELIFGRRVLGSSSDRKYYNHYGSNSGPLKKGSGIELSSRDQRSGTLGGGGAGRKQKGVFITQITAEIDSQESILRATKEEGKGGGETRSQGGSLGESHASVEVSVGVGGPAAPGKTARRGSNTMGIHRTDDVIVSYENHDGRAEVRDGWRRF